MFESLEDLATRLSATGYFIDPVMVQVVFLAAKLEKPIILEGPAGSGKTQLAVAVAQTAGTHVERLQCYEGITDKQAIGEFDQGLQRLYMEFCKDQGLNWQEILQTLKGRDFFRPGPPDASVRMREAVRSPDRRIGQGSGVDRGFAARTALRKAIVHS